MKIDGLTVRANLAIVNSGQTPAYRFDHSTWIAAGYEGIATKFAEGIRNENSQAHLSRGANIGILPQSNPLPDKLIIDIRRRAAVVWVWGTIWYDDAFGEAHYTKFKFIYKSDETDPPGLMRSAEDGNEAT